ncbi:MAG: hypothetical protein E2O39_01775 [Planctomycetota bacterium]|nr:MAG: hypothetical protein E2O39_01775 [Planctomycetota bacterium]
MAEWKIERRQGACSACERPFDEGERHVSTLAFRADVLARDDLCEPCFEERRAGTGGPGQADAGAEDLLWWFTRHSVAKKRTLQLDLPTLERLFLDLEGRAEQHARELRYVLCLLLMRKRRLKLETIERGAEGESFLVKRPRHEERYRVFAFDFDADRMSELQSQLQAIFDGVEGEDGVQLPTEDGSTAGQPEATAAD